MSNGVRTALQVVLLLVIVGLGYWLYRSINDPWAEQERLEAVTQSVRDRMLANRQVLLRFYEANRRYPQTLDSVVIFARQDSAMMRNADSLLAPFFRGPVQLDSLLYSPRTGNRFEYVSSDTARVPYYKLSDPDSDDFIGTDRGEITRINAASWE